LYARVDAAVGARTRALGWDARPGESREETATREHFAGLLAALGDPGLSRLAVAQATAAPSRALRFLKPDLLCAAVRAEPAVFDRVLAAATGAEDGHERRLLAAALGAAHDPARLTHALDLLLVPADADAGYALLAGAEREGALLDVVAQYLLDHAGALQPIFKTHGLRPILTALTASCDATRADALHARTLAAFGGNRRTDAQIERAFRKMARCAAARPAQVARIEAWLAGPP
ncbi:MAG TPA: ERAP1-like C-terminal domain-containing protein, partial [Kofleriaceae bacterium]|nr:ERAP1-like C-terminal domain-containing protein [Kofleriaceae bacterium]